MLCNHDEGHRLSCVDSIHVRRGKKTVYLQMPILEKAYNKTLLWLQKKLLGGRRILSGLQRTGIASRCIRDRLHLHLELLSPEGLRELSVFDVRVSAMISRRNFMLG